MDIVPIHEDSKINKELSKSYKEYQIPSQALFVVFFLLECFIYCFGVIRLIIGWIRRVIAVFMGPNNLCTQSNLNNWGLGQNWCDLIRFIHI